MTVVKHDTLQEALVAAQSEMPAVEPNAVNPHFKSKFVSLGHLIAKTRPVLNKHGLAITQEPTYLNDRPALRTSLVHVSGGERTSVMMLILGKDDMQGLGSALTYSKRYMWAAVIGLSDEEDDDGNQASAPTPTRPTPQTPKAQNASQGVGLITEKQMKLVGAVLRKLGDGGVLDEDGYRAKLNEMNVDSTRDLTGPQASVLIDWLKELEAAMDVEL